MKEMTKLELRRFVSRWFPSAKVTGRVLSEEDLHRIFEPEAFKALRAVLQEQFDVIKRLYPDSRDAIESEFIGAAEYMSRSRATKSRSTSTLAQDRLEGARYSLIKADRAFQLWALRALRTKVEMLPSGLAILRHPDADFRVEIVWLWDRKEKTHRPSQLRVIADGELTMADVGRDDDYVAAFLIHAVTRRFLSVRAPSKRPAAGKPLSPDFYIQLQESYDHLINEGHKAPAKELASRMGENHSTVKSWLHRGNKYLQGEKS